MSFLACRLHLPRRSGSSARLATRLGRVAARRRGRLLGLLVAFALPGLFAPAVGLAQARSAVVAAEFPPELVRFEADRRNPVFTAAGPGHWDVKIRERGWILKDHDRWHLWYSGYDGTRVNRVRLGYATSDDGITWQRQAGNPIDVDDWIEDPVVFRDQEMFHLIAEGRDDQPHWFTSTDGLKWHRQGGLDIRRVDGRPVESGPLGTPTVLRTAEGWNLLYERRDAGVWLARSPDLRRWTNVRDEPVLTRDPDGLDAVMIALNQVIEYRGKYYAYYHGTRTPQRPRLWSTNVAVSSDLISWRKYPGNPLLPEAENKSSGLVVFDGERFRLYTMHERVDLHWGERPAR
ncbi:MAG: glycosylase [Planctomycetaceae bacterium]